MRLIKHFTLGQGLGNTWNGTVRQKTQDHSFWRVISYLGLGANNAPLSFVEIVDSKELTYF
jgi:hypothetical protein